MASSIQHYDPKDGATKIHASDAAIKAAERARDPDIFEKAIRKNLEAKRDFAADYKGRFSAGRPKKNSVRSGGIISHENYCASFGFSSRSVQKWCERLLSKELFEKEIGSRLKAAQKRFIDDTEAANYSSEDVEWYTPSEYIETVRAVLGTIDLDPASCSFANQIVGAVNIFTAADDALTREWHGSVFLNPPYGVKDGDSLAGVFCAKAIAEYQSGRAEAAIILVNSVHAQKWQAPLYEYPICFVDHRIAFMSSDGQVNKSPTFMNMFAYLGKNRQKFAEEFSRWGYVMARVSA